MQDIFTADWFYDEKNIGSKIKSPIELVAGIQRALPMELQNDQALLIVQRVLGQMLFYPPNVAGWPGGKAWIDSSSLMVRLRLPQLFANNDELNVRPKTDDDVMGGRTEDGEPNVNKPKRAFAGVGNPVYATVNWEGYTKIFETVPRDQLLTVLQAALLQVPLHTAQKTVQQFADSSSREAFIKSATVRLMSTPEYQLC